MDIQDPEILSLLSAIDATRRKLHGEKTKRGQQRAREAGVYIGRPRLYSTAQLDEVRDLRQQGYSLAQVARMTGISPETCRRACQP